MNIFYLLIHWNVASKYIVRNWELIVLPLEYSSVHMTLEYNLNYESQ